MSPSCSTYPIDKKYLDLPESTSSEIFLLVDRFQYLSCDSGSIRPLILPTAGNPGTGQPGTWNVCANDQQQITH